jgi:hypothetical protein
MKKCFFFCPHIIHPKQHADWGVLVPSGQEGRGGVNRFSNFVLWFVPSTSLSSLDKKKDQFNSSLLTTLNPKPYYFTYYYTF